MTTSSDTNFDKISPTALLTAYARKFTNIPYTQEIAELTNAIATVEKLGDWEQTKAMIAFFAVHTEGRYKAIEQVRTQFHSTQILELASGLLPRGTVLSQQVEITFIESDLPAMIQQKQQLVQQLVGERSNLHFLEIDATRDLNSSRLYDYFQRDRSVTVLCEGLLMYLSFAEKQQVLANVREILQTFGGVWITPDLLVTKKEDIEKMRQDSAASQQMAKFERFVGRPLIENMFTDPDQVKQFIQEQGFQMEVFSTSEVLDQLECLSALEIDRNLAKEILKTIPVFALKLA
jgi:O-methyltransferase involved in polyketide biosynthesis